MKYPENLLYHPEHTWVKVEVDVATVGITDFAQDELGDIVFIELPEEGDKVETGEIFGTIESSKSVSELFSPVNGVVKEVNTALEDSPEVINDDPYVGGWIVKVTLDPDPGTTDLLDKKAYARQIEE